MLSESSSHFPKYTKSATAIIKHHGCLRYLSCRTVLLVVIVLWGVLKQFTIYEVSGPDFCRISYHSDQNHRKQLHLSTLHPTVAIVANISDLLSLLFVSRGWKMPQWPRAHAALAKDPGSAATIQVRQLRTTGSPAPGWSDAFVLLGSPLHSSTHIHTQKHKHLHHFKIVKIYLLK